MLRFNNILKSKRGVVLLVVMLIILLLVGLAFALSIVAISTYESALNAVNQQQATYQSKSTALVITEQLLEGDFTTGGFVQQLTNQGANGQLTGSYVGPNGEKGQFQIYYPSFANKTEIYVTVTAIVGQEASSVTTVLHGEPMEIVDLIDDYNLYITSPNGTYSFDRMTVTSGSTMKLYISADATNGHTLTNTSPSEFPYSSSGTSQVTISGDLDMTDGTYNAIVTAYGTLNINNVRINNYAYIRDNLSMINSYIQNTATAYGNVTVSGGISGNAVGQGILAGGNVSISNTTIGATGNVAIRNKANVTVTGSTINGGINTTGAVVSVLSSSTVNGTITATGNGVVTSSTVNGNVNVKGNLTLTNATINGNVKVDGNVTMFNSTINGSLNTKGNLDILGTSPSKISSNCIIDGKIATSKLDSGYHQFGNTTTCNNYISSHTWDANTNTVLSVKLATGAWDGTEIAVKLFSVIVAGTVKTNFKVVFTDNINDAGKTSYIYKLYVSQAYSGKQATVNTISNTNLNTGWSQGYCTSIQWNDIAPPAGIDSPVVSFFDYDTNLSSYWYSYGDYAQQIPNTTYTVSMYVKTNDSNFRIRFYTADNYELGRVYSGYITVANDGDWHRVVWPSFLNPADSQSNSLSFQFNFGNPQGETQRTWLCAPQMEKGTSATAYNSIDNTTVRALDLFGSEITYLYLVNSAGVRQDGWIVNGVINNLYGNNLHLEGISQLLIGTYETISLELLKYVILPANTIVPSNMRGNIYTNGSLYLGDNVNFTSTVRVYASGGLTVNGNATRDQASIIYASGTINISGPVGNLVLASNAGALTLASGVTITGDIKSTGSAGMTINGIVEGSVYNGGPITVSGRVNGNIKTTSTVTVNSGAIIGTTNANQVYAGAGLSDNGSATINANIYNNSSARLTITSACNGIYTLGPVTIQNHGTTAFGNIIANGTEVSYIRRSVTGSVQVGGVLDMYDTSCTGLRINKDAYGNGGNVKATNALFFSTIVEGNVHATGSVAASYAIQLEGSSIYGSAYAVSGNMRLGGGCTIGQNLSGAYNARTAIYSGGEVNFSASNIAYGNVYCITYLTSGTNNVEGTANTIYGDLYANSSATIFHSAVGAGNGASSYQGIYSNGVINISDTTAGNGTIAYVRGVGTINITGYNVTGDVYGNANITLTNSTAGRAIAREGSGTTISNWVKLYNSPVYGDVFSNYNFIQNDSTSKISGSLRVNSTSGSTTYINAAVQGTVFVLSSGNVSISTGLSFSAGCPKAVGGNLYATKNVTIGNSSSIGGNVTSNSGDIIIGNSSSVGGNVKTDASAGGSVTIGTNSPVTGGVGAKSNIDINTGSNVGGNVYTDAGTLVLRANVGGSVYSSISLWTADNTIISGNINVTGTALTTINGSIYGNIYTNGALTISATSGTAGSRRIGTNGLGTTLRCNGALLIVSQYIVYSNVNNTTGNMIINNNVNGNIECPVGELTVTGNVVGTIRSANNTIIGTISGGGNITGNLYVYNSIITPTVTVYGPISANVSIKGNFNSYGVISGVVQVQGNYVPINVYNFPNIMTINGDLALNFGSSNGTIGYNGAAINVSGTLSIEGNTPGIIDVPGEIVCGNLRVNTTANVPNVSTIVTRATITSWPGSASKAQVKFYNDVNVQANAYVLGAVFQNVTGSGLGSTAFIGGHLATRDSIYYGHGYVNNATVATNSFYGSLSVGYEATTTTNLLTGRMAAPNYNGSYNSVTVPGYYIAGVGSDTRSYINAAVIPISPSTVYNFSCLYWTSDGSTLDDIYLNFNGTGYPEGNVYIQPTSSSQASNVINTNLGGGWYRRSGSFTSTSNTTQINSIFFDSDVAGLNVFISEIQLQTGSVATGYTIGTSAQDKGSIVTQGCTIYSRTQVKGDAYYLHTYLESSNTTTAAQKISHYVGGNLTLEGSRIEGHATDTSMDTMTIVNNNCTLIQSSGWLTHIGNSGYLNRNNDTYYLASFKGLYVNGTLVVGASTGVYVDTYAYTIVNNGVIQVGDMWIHTD